MIQFYPSSSVSGKHFQFDRTAKYGFSIKVQFVDENNQYQVVSSGMLVEILGVRSKSNKSKVGNFRHLWSQVKPIRTK